MDRWFTNDNFIQLVVKTTDVQTLVSEPESDLVNVAHLEFLSVNSNVLAIFLVFGGTENK